MAFKCPKCHFENPYDTTYCSNCATPLQASEDISVSRTKTIRKPSVELPTGSIFSGRCKIIEELGKGGKGIVYKSEDTNFVLQG